MQVVELPKKEDLIHLVILVLTHPVGIQRRRRRVPIASGAESVYCSIITIPSQSVSYRADVRVNGKIKVHSVSTGARLLPMR